MKKVMILMCLGIFGLISFPSEIQINANAEVPLPYEPSVMMPEAKLCPSKMSYYTACVQYGMGCNPDGCHDD